MKNKGEKFKHQTKKLIHSFGYAFQGLYSAFKSERNMKIHIVIMTLVILFGVLFKISIINNNNYLLRILYKSQN